VTPPEAVLVRAPYAGSSEYKSRGHPPQFEQRATGIFEAGTHPFVVSTVKVVVSWIALHTH